MFDDVIGQETAKRILANQIETSRIPSAYLFHGELGVGKRRTAISLAKALNCEEGNGCGKCSACRRIEGYAHPDVQVVFPVSSTMKPDELAELFERGRACGFRFPFSQKTSISIDAIRSVSAKIFVKPHEGKLKVIIIMDADRMTLQASNAFLKTLEEPPLHAVFILITDRPYSLLPTVLSRCQPIRFRNLSVKEIASALEERGVESERRDLASRLASGSLGRALLHCTPEYLKIRKSLAQEFFDLPKKELGEVIDFSQWLVDSCDPEMFAKTFISLYRDLLCLKETKEELTHNSDYLPDLWRRAESCRQEGILQSIRKLDDFVASLEKSVNLKVAIPPLLYSLA
jgi:DNA polymerase-3 subunit delta'